MNSYSLIDIQRVGSFKQVRKVNDVTRSKVISLSYLTHLEILRVVGNLSIINKNRFFDLPKGLSCSAINIVRGVYSQIFS